jgi:hypothetical protein
MRKPVKPIFEISAEPFLACADADHFRCTFRRASLKGGRDEVCPCPHHAAKLAMILARIFNPRARAPRPVHPIATAGLIAAILGRPEALDTVIG